MGELDLNGQIVLQFETQTLMQDLRHIIEQARGHVAVTANYEQTMMYWHIGERINREVLGNQRAEYGKQIVAQVARQLQEEYGKKGFDEKSIRRMMQFAALFPDELIVAQLARKLFWSHFIEVLPLKDSLQREFYITMAASGRWGRDKVKGIAGDIIEESVLGCKKDSKQEPDILVDGVLTELKTTGMIEPWVYYWYKSPVVMQVMQTSTIYSQHSPQEIPLLCTNRNHCFLYSEYCNKKLLRIRFYRIQYN